MTRNASTLPKCGSKWEILLDTAATNVVVVVVAVAVMLIGARRGHSTHARDAQTYSAVQRGEGGVSREWAVGKCSSETKKCT